MNKGLQLILFLQLLLVSCVSLDVGNYDSDKNDSYVIDEDKKEDNGAKGGSCKDLVGHWDIPHNGAVTYADGTTCTCKNGEFTCDRTGRPTYIPLDCSPVTNCTCKDPNYDHIFKSGDASNYDEDVCTCVKGYWYCLVENKYPSKRCIDFDGSFVSDGEVQSVASLICTCKEGLYSCEVEEVEVEEESEEEEEDYIEEYQKSCYQLDGYEVPPGEVVYMSEFSRCKCHNGKFVDCECKWDQEWYTYDSEVPISDYQTCKCGMDGLLEECQCLHHDNVYAIGDTMEYNDMSCECDWVGWKCCKKEEVCVENKRKKCVRHDVDCENEECIQWRGRCLRKEPVCLRYEQVCVDECCAKYGYECNKYERVCGAQSWEYNRGKPFCERMCTEYSTYCTEPVCSKYEVACVEVDESQDEMCVEYDCNKQCQATMCTNWTTTCAEYNGKDCKKMEQDCKPMDHESAYKALV